jgi:hypothetical protein
MKGLLNGFSIRTPGQNLVPAQPKLGQRLSLPKIGVCHTAKTISGGEYSTLIPVNRIHRTATFKLSLLEFDSMLLDLTTLQSSICHEVELEVHFLKSGGGLSLLV